MKLYMPVLDKETLLTNVNQYIADKVSDDEFINKFKSFFNNDLMNSHKEILEEFSKNRFGKKFTNFNITLIDLIGICEYYNELEIPLEVIGMSPAAACKDSSGTHYVYISNAIAAESASVMEILVHERVHMKQMEDGRFDGDAESFIWEGKKYPREQMEECFKNEHPLTDDPLIALGYNQLGLPWELEAYGKQAKYSKAITRLANVSYKKYKESEQGKFIDYALKQYYRKHPMERLLDTAKNVIVYTVFFGLLPLIAILGLGYKFIYKPLFKKEGSNKNECKGTT